MRAVVFAGVRTDFDVVGAPKQSDRNIDLHVECARRATHKDKRQPNKHNMFAVEWLQRKPYSRTCEDNMHAVQHNPMNLQCHRALEVR